MDAGRLLAELRSYVGFTDADAALLARFRPTAEPHFRAIADEFYAVVRMHAGAFEVLKDEEQTRRLHASLQVWLRELLSGPHDEAYVLRHARVGEAHVRVGLQLRYMVTAMSRIRVSLQRIAAEDLARDAEAAATRLAIARVCDMDLAIMLESYKEDLVERLERVRVREQEALSSQLDERQRLFTDALEAAEVVVLGLDLRGTVVIANRKAVELTGYAQDELSRGDVFELLFGTRAAEIRRTWMSAAAALPVEVEAEIITRAKRVRVVRWHASAHAGAQMPTLVVIGVDLTKERELERRARQNERLAAAGALAAGLAHEIRNPLNGASLHVSVLDRALARVSGVPESAREATDVLRNEIRRLGALVTDFLEVARPKPLARTECDVNDVARSVTVLLTPEAEARRVHLELDQFPFPATANIDVERVKQVLVNLLRNALEAVGDAGHVGVRVRRLPRDVEIEVHDDGPGLPDPNAPIFDAFYTTKERGTGLGLSIVHRIVADHGGDVTYTSQPGATTFTVRLPADVPAMPAR